ncbi:dna-directed rna polymerase [Holotrichia oblita]|uniref:Dna-directed rna polymerase n=1 Tax=Holotrichia oblita TaxID=644536 RepID=A0ACB9SLT0_HOLOL|nr:dna-directed rna polymerase [Holotrichia oblita]
MARQNKKNDMVPKHLNPDNIIFSIFTEEEIKKLSVLKICNTITFDALGYPVSGGLYDKCLGPLSERGDPCGTCFQNIYQCPGHYGHIELPLPVINPIFTKIIATILKMTCYSCFRIQIPESIKQSLSIQMRLLDKGLITEAIEIQSRISGAISDDGTFENISPESLSTISEYKKLTGSLDTDYNTALNKNIEGLKNQFLSNTLKEIKTKKSCIYCKQQLNKLNAVKDKFILVTKVVKGGSKIVTSESKHLNPEEIKTHLRSLWGNDRDVLVQLVPVLSMVESQYPTDVFFFKVIPVPPPNVRPANFVAGRVTENNQSQIYKAILHDVFLLNVIIKVIQNDGRVNILDEAATGAYTVARGSSSLEKLHLAWDSLQYNVNNILDKQGRDTGGEQGLKQIIEKKAGIIRMHMMGKRVNYAARSVITPDPNLNVDEIGIPEEFAKKLTYPVPVTSWNVEQLRKIIMNGPNVHPGAVMVEFEDGSITRINPKNQTQQESLLKRLLTPDDGGDGYKGVKMVHRHLCNGDILLLNRQPTLHRPSIMAHTARILKGEKTLRLHYANCKAYNADFDGDEMNAHFPQNELARSEGYILANVCNQYLVPKDGTPLSGLIQDHMISGVGLTVRGKFFNKYDYQQLVFQALSYKTSDIKLLPPAIIKPCMLWSGKQILSTVFLNIIPEGSVPINLTSTSKISAKSWQTRPAGKWIYGGTKLEGDDMSEAQVIIRHGELLVGVLDKTHYGATPYGLIHCMYELYGGTYATRLLSSLAKLFTCFLQWEGFTLGVHDILVTEEANTKRKKIIEESRQVGKSTMMAALGLTEDVSLNEIVNKIEEVAAIDPKLRSVIDRQYKTNLDSFTNDINKVCLPAGLLCKFPENNLQLMVQSGAKGSTVNTMQISCLLGQIELEGKRPPIMISGKSLPSFPVFEFAPRAGGYIDGRFMTGIQPQEFFFHCMAGREGLIDTAVKTSRSGYLQRCLIKHLEGITIGYDLTVRDSDKSVIQFYYGEDGMDISKSQFLNSKQLKFLFENAKAILDKDMIKQLKCVDDYDAMNEYDAKINSWKSKYGQPLAKERRTAFTVFSAVAGPKLNMNNGDKISEKTGRSRKTKTILKLWNKAGDDIKDRYKEQCLRCPDPVNSIYQPDCYFGSLNERLTELMRQNSMNLTKKKDKRRFEDMLKLKSMHGICAPGEPVGLLAAQSIGEPSTQMTLNTFHFAGRGEMNVTLGIPRLREILMMASKSIKTPSMEIPFLDVPNLERKAERLRKTLTKVVVANVLEKIDVTSVLDTSPVRQQRYTLRFHFLPHHLYKDDYAVKPKYILKHMTKKYFSQMFYAIKRLAKANSSLVTIEEEKKSSRFRSNNDEDDDEAGEANVSKAGLEMDSSDEEVDDPEDAKTTRKYQQVHEGQEAQDEEDKDLERDMSDEEDVNQEGEKTKVQGQTKDDNIEATQNAVVDSYEYVKNYNYDTKDHQWCELTYHHYLKKIDITAVLKETAAKSVMWETPNIKRAITYMKDDVLTLRTDGINIVEMFKYNELLDLNRLYSNDIHKVAENYGIEAAAKVIVKEVQDVFKVYGITVDPRHLLLIADYMTYNGTFEPLSRKGMENSASPLQQMSFESSLTFLKNATLKGKQDQLQNPSSCLMVGKPCTTGTGSFTLLQKFPVLSA